MATRVPASSAINPLYPCTHPVFLSFEQRQAVSHHVQLLKTNFRFVVVRIESWLRIMHSFELIVRFTLAQVVSLLG